MDGKISMVDVLKNARKLYTLCLLQLSFTLLAHYLLRRVGLTLSLKQSLYLISCIFMMFYYTHLTKLVLWNV